MPVGAVDGGEAVHVWGLGVTSAQLSCEPKTTPRNCLL